jgi:hypothetical protein
LNGCQEESCSAVPPSPTPTPTPTPPPSGWTPADFTNLYDWWTSDSGVNTTGSDVDSWVGYSGNTLTPFNSSLKASYSATDSDFDNEPSITMNPTSSFIDCGYTTNMPTATTSKTSIVIGKLITKRSNDNPLSTWSEGVTPRAGIWGQPGTDYLLYDSTNLNYTGNTWVNGTYQIIMMSYNRTSGDFSFFPSNNTSGLTTPYLTTNVSANLNFVSGLFGLASYIGAYGLTPTMKIVETIWINGIPTNTEITNYITYLSTKYGI